MGRYASAALTVLMGIGLVGYAIASDEQETPLPPVSSPRVVVFESFMSTSCEVCQDAGYYIDLLASAYAGRPVVFVEHDVSAPLGTRWQRFLAANSSSNSIPITMLESGNQVHSGGAESFEKTYKQLIEAELVRPPQGEVSAFHRRVGDTLQFYIRMRNNTTDTLDFNNAAALTALVWEDTFVGTTSRYVRAAPFSGIDPALPPGGEATYILSTNDLTSVNWDKLHAVAFVDYQPIYGKPYNMLQAAISKPVGFSVSPNNVQINIDADDPKVTPTLLSFDGPYPLTWNATLHGNWLTLDQMSGSVDSKPTLSIALDKLARGWQEGSVEMTATSSDGMNFVTFLPLRVYYGARTLRIDNAAGTPGGTVSIPVSVESVGSESRFDFSIAYNGSVFSSPRVRLSAAASGASLLVDQSQTSQGRLGVSIVLPGGSNFPSGITPVAEINFAVAGAVERPNQLVQFSDRPLPRVVTDRPGAELFTHWQDGTVTISGAQGPRPRRRFGR